MIGLWLSKLGGSPPMLLPKFVNPKCLATYTTKLTEELKRSLRLNKLFFTIQSNFLKLKIFITKIIAYMSLRAKSLECLKTQKIKPKEKILYCLIEVPSIQLQEVKFTTWAALKLKDKNILFTMLRKWGNVFCITQIEHLMMIQWENQLKAS